MNNVLKLHYKYERYLIDIVDEFGAYVCVFVSKTKDEAEDTFLHLQDVLEVTPDNWLEHHKL